MAIIDIEMPKLGESIMEATILRWLKKVGDPVAADEMILEIATDKVDSEVPSTTSGVLTEILFNVNDVVPIGAVIARVATEGIHEASNTIQPAAEAPSVAIPASSVSVTETIAETHSNVQNISNSDKFFSPLVLNIASSEKIPFSELEKINGTGKDGRVTKNDILNYVANRNKSASTQTESAPAIVNQSTTAPVVEAAPIASTPVSNSNYGTNIEIIEMDRMRKLIAEHMVRSKQTSPHVTSFVEADVTNLVLWREKVKNDFEKREHTKITFTPLFVEAVAKCIKKFPLINSSVDGTNILVKKDINIGMATALPNGNLIVPVIKNADQLNIVGLSKKVNELAKSARDGKLKADDTQGGTFTITNVGTFNNLTGTPIINQPQVAILALGAIKKRPVVIETPQGDSIAIRHMMYLSLSYDHRIVDGSLGASFLAAVGKELEDFKGSQF